MLGATPNLSKHDLATVAVVNAHLERVLGQVPTMFRTQEDIANLTYDQALWCMRWARRTLLSHLLHQELHEHMEDDCGDYLSAATDNWNFFWEAWDQGDGTEASFVATVKEWLQDAETIGGCDGEVRFDLVSEELADLLYYPEQ